MMWGWGLGMGWWMLFGGLIFILFWGAIIWLIIWAIKRVVHSSSGNVSGSNTPLDIAKERYARGEITREQFEQLKKDIGS